MDFFRAQDQARRNSAILIVYFALTLAFVISGVYLLFAGMMVYNNPDLSWWWPDLFFKITLFFVVIVTVGASVKLLGFVIFGALMVPESLGGRLVSRATEVLAERRLLNVVDEMAIAAGVAVPGVYVLDDESAINAFAAGYKPGDAVIAVTRGALDQLSRDELQGVIAHEFSHLLNEDAKLNLWLVCLLNGILLIAVVGRLLRNSASSLFKKTPIYWKLHPKLLVTSFLSAVTGVFLSVWGYIGVLAARIIKAAISRQREFLADAAAVQFTRNPHGLVGALKKIAGLGSQMHHHRAEEVSHLFFGEGVTSWARLLATHPSLEERIQRLDATFRPEAPQLEAVATLPSDDNNSFLVSAQAFAVAAGEVRDQHLEYAHHLIDRLPEAITRDLQDLAGARAVVIGLLLSHDSATADRQLALIAAKEQETLRDSAVAHAGWLKTHGTRFRLPLLELALPALRELSAPARADLLKLAHQLVAEDRRLDLFEFAVLRLLKHRLDESWTKERKAPRQPSVIRADCILLLSALVYAGSKEADVHTTFAEAMKIAPIEGTPTDMAPCDSINLQSIGTALTRLAPLPLRFRQRLIQAGVSAIMHDGAVTLAEGEMLRAVSAALDVPLSPLLPESVAI